MRNFQYLFFTIIFLSLTGYSLIGQETPPKPSINDGSIGEQFEFAIKKSNNYTDGNGRSYEVIKRTMLLDLKKNTLDSINAVQTRLDQSTTQVNTQQQEITALKTKLTKTQETLDATRKEKDSMQLMGTQMSKSGYNTLLWSLIGGLFASLLFFIFKFKNSNLITKTARQDLSELETEFKEHRRTALEREQRINRQLQDEINKGRI